MAASFAKPASSSLLLTTASEAYPAELAAQAQTWNS
jgi:hypothetical protein